MNDDQGIDECVSETGHITAQGDPPGTARTSRENTAAQTGGRGGPAGYRARVQEKRFDFRWVIAVGAALGLLGWFLSGVQWDETLAVLARARWSLLLAAAALLVFEYALRSWRWAYLVEDLDPDVGFYDLWAATSIGATFNTFLPLRGGDLVRVAVLAKQRRLPFTAVLSTTIVEKLLDAFGLVAALMAMLWFLPPDIAESGFVAQLSSGGMWIAGMAMVLLVVTLLMGTRGAQLGFYRLLGPLPKPVRARVFLQFKALVAGLSAIGSPLRLVPGLGLTLAILANGWAAIICAFMAFGLDLPYITGLFVELAVFLSVAIPQAPGFIGLFQVVLEETMGLFGASVGEAQAMAIVLWALYFLPITIVGAIDTWRMGSGLTNFREELFGSFDEAALGDDAPSEIERATED